MLKEFIAFLKEYKIVSLAVAFVMGAASISLINSLVKDVMMPIIAPLLSGKSWQEAVWAIGPVSITYGAFIAELINFVIIALVVFIIVRKLFKLEQKVGK